MSRKRKSDQTPPTETPTAVAELPAPETPAPTVEQPPVEAGGNGLGFAERVGQKQRALMADPFGIASDKLAGVRLMESRQDRQMAIKFGDGRPEDRPSQAVIDKMKEAGFRWNPSDRIWVHPVRQEYAMAIRIDAEKLYQEVRQMIRQEKGIEATQDIPF